MNAIEKSYETETLLASLPHLSGPAWLDARRKKALEQFKAMGFPTRKHEAWKYLYLEGLIGRNFQPSKLNLKVPALPYVTTDFGKISWAEKTLGAETSTEINPFVFLNLSQFEEGVFIHVPKDTAIAEPLKIELSSRDANSKSALFQPRILVVAEAGSKFNLILDFQGKHSEWMNGVVEFVLAPNASVSCNFRQQAEPQAVQFLNVRARLQEGSRLDMTGITTGGAMTRNDIHVDLDGAEAFCALAGLSILDQRSQAFQHVTVNHRYLNCTSRQVYKNILAGDSVAEFNSMVHVWRCAQKSDSEQLDKNLLLSEGARVYSRPQLKIDNDDVRASHGAATGQMEKDELFYLQSRGIPKDQARYLMIYGFAQEVLQKVQPEALRKEWTAPLENQILKVAGMK